MTEPPVSTPPNNAAQLGGVLSGAVLIALVTLVGYGFVFLYEAGFCSLYHIPLSLISFNLTTGFVAAPSVLLVLWIISGLPANIRLLLKTDERMGRASSLAVATGAFIVPFTSHMNGIALLILGSVVFLFLFGVFALGSVIGRRNINAKLASIPGESERLQYLKKRSKTLDEEIKNLDSVISFSPFVWLVSRGPRVTTIVAMIFLTSILVYCLGRFNAKSEPHYLMKSYNRRYIVLRIYGDSIITAPFVLKRAASMGSSANDVIVVMGAIRVFKVGDRDTPPMLARRWNQDIEPFSQTRKTGFGAWVFPYTDF